MCAALQRRVAEEAVLVLAHRSGHAHAVQSSRQRGAARKKATPIIDQLHQRKTREQPECLWVDLLRLQLLRMPPLDEDTRRPVCLTVRKAERGTEDRLLLDNEVIGHDVVSRSSVLMCVLQAGGDAEIPRPVTVSSFHQWCTTRPQEPLKLRCMSVLEIITVLQVRERVRVLGQKCVRTASLVFLPFTHAELRYLSTIYSCATSNLLIRVRGVGSGRPGRQQR